MTYWVNIYLERDKLGRPFTCPGSLRATRGIVVFYESHVRQLHCRVRVTLKPGVTKL